MPKTLEQLQFYQAHYIKISRHAKTEGKKVLNQYLKKLNAKIKKLQKY